MKIVMLGNFGPVYSTESHHKWTWEKLGHQVITLQENRATTSDVLAACHGAQIFQYTHTHGWFTPGTMPVEEMLQRVRKMGVKSFSYHLDLYWGLNTLDSRQTRIGEHPSWKVDTFYSTDGRPELPWAEKGVNHVYLPAGVVEYGVFMGTPQPSQVSDVGFVGSIGYHPEYDFRTKLVEGLRSRYGNRFRTYAGLRETPLNNAYASIKVVVGDHCFAGIPRYASDRLFETIGRGGFIVYPETAGVTELIPGLVTYKPQDIADLCSKINYFLDPAHEQERIDRRNTAHEWVKNNATYSHRLKFILENLGY
jgi:hypothetical protein